MPDTHPLNRSIFVADNLDLLKSLDSESVDLVCCDPPFSKNKIFKGEIKPALSRTEIAAEENLLRQWGILNREDAAKAGILWPDDSDSSEAEFADIWNYENSVKPEWVEQISKSYPALKKTIDAAFLSASESMAAYLTYMAVRIIEIHRVLNPTGSFFIHCDWEANSYLRLVLDVIFGRDNFVNEIAWCYAPSGQVPKRGFPRKHDSIFFYAKNSQINKFFHQYNPLTEKQVKRFAQTDESGRRCKEHKTATKMHRTYLDESKGSVISSWWTDIPSFGQIRNSGERTGYPTQKPVALAERIIKAVTEEGDVVLDPFAGCGYVAVAAERLDRQWIACDVSIRALTVLHRQFAKFYYNIDDSKSEEKLNLSIMQAVSRSPFDLPQRTDI